MILIMIGFWMWISLALDLGLDVDPSWTQLQQIPDESPLKTHSSYIEEHIFVPYCIQQRAAVVLGLFMSWLTEKFIPSWKVCAHVLAEWTSY